MPRRSVPDPPLPALFTARQALAAGLTRGQIYQRLRSGSWVRLETGTYRRADWHPGFEADEHVRARLDHAHRAIASVRRNPGCVIGFQSAAVIHQMSLFSPLPDSVVLIAAPGHWNGPRNGLVIRQASLERGHVSGKSVPVTTPERTWFDIARSASLADGLAVGDTGLRRGVLHLADARTVLAGADRVRGCRRAVLAMEHLSGMRETVLESGSWAYFVEHGVALPKMQVEFRRDDARLIGRVDFFWERDGLVGECDGRMKYADPDSIYQEKRREDELRSLGLGMVRWGWADLKSSAVASRLRRIVGTS